MKKKNKYIFLLTIIFSILVTSLIILDTYALFETDAVSTTELDIGSWVIKLNNTDVTYTRNITLSNFTYNNGQHTASGYFAPGTSAYFDLIIDVSDSDVSVEYLLDIDDSCLEDYPNIYFSVTDMNTNQTTSTNSYTGVIPLSSQTRTLTLRINLVWDNQLQYDESDTSLIGEELEFGLVANFKQYVGNVGA